MLGFAALTPTYAAGNNGKATPGEGRGLFLLWPTEWPTAHVASALPTAVIPAQAGIQ